MNDDRITSLRTWIQWFKIKSVELDAQLNKQKSSHIAQKQDYQDKKASETFLKNALKDSMKQNKLLKNACEKQQH